jgi:hypothetical protein
LISFLWSFFVCRLSQSSAGLSSMEIYSGALAPSPFLMPPHLVFTLFLSVFSPQFYIPLWIAVFYSIWVYILVVRKIRLMLSWGNMNEERSHNVYAMRYYPLTLVRCVSSFLCSFSSFSCHPSFLSLFLFLFFVLSSVGHLLHVWNGKPTLSNF